MKTAVIWIVVVVVAIGLSAWWFIKPATRVPPASSTATTTPEATTTNENLLPDVYPLYSGVSWGDESTTTYEQFSGYQLTSAIQPDITNIAGISVPFENYYATKLVAAGWSIDNSLAAGGAGSEIIAYKKGNDEIIISYNSLFNMGSPNSPAQCPCEVTLQIFSGSK
jgi:hypothetical protein